jgi:hypothetical protein
MSPSHRGTIVIRSAAWPRRASRSPIGPGSVWQTPSIACWACCARLHRSPQARNRALRAAPFGAAAPAPPLQPRQSPRTHLEPRTLNLEPPKKSCQPHPTTLTPPTHTLQYPSPQKYFSQKWHFSYAPLATIEVDINPNEGLPRAGLPHLNSRGKEGVPLNLGPCTPNVYLSNCGNLPHPFANRHSSTTSATTPGGSHHSSQPHVINI